MVVIALVVALAVALGAAVVVLARSGRALVEGRLDDVEERLGRRLGEIHERVDSRFEGLDGRLLAAQQNAGQTATQIVDRLGKLDTSAAQMLQRANDLARLEQALRPPKARGGVGELLLEKLLADSLPADSYQRQYTFRSGDRVDAVVRAEKLLPIDAKFPLDNFERLTAAEGDADREL